VKINFKKLNRTTRKCTKLDINRNIKITWEREIYL